MADIRAAIVIAGAAVITGLSTRDDIVATDLGTSAARAIPTGLNRAGIRATVTDIGVAVITSLGRIQQAIATNDLMAVTGVCVIASPFRLDHTDIRATIARRGAVVVTGLGAGHDPVAASRGANAGLGRTVKARFDLTGRRAAIVGVAVAVITGFAIVRLDGAVAARNQRHARTGRCALGALVACGLGITVIARLATATRGRGTRVTAAGADIAGVGRHRRELDDVALLSGTDTPGVPKVVAVEICIEVSGLARHMARVISRPMLIGPVHRSTIVVARIIDADHSAGIVRPDPVSAARIVGMVGQPDPRQQSAGRLLGIAIFLSTRDTDELALDAIIYTNLWRRARHPARKSRCQRPRHRYAHLRRSQSATARHPTL